MSITIADGLKLAIVNRPDHIVLQVKYSSDVEKAISALNRARIDIAKLGGREPSLDYTEATQITGPMCALDGPFITLDGSKVDPQLLRTIPDLITRHLGEAGVTNALITAVEAGDVWGGALWDLPRAVVLRLYPTPRGQLGDMAPLPESWIDAAQKWVRSDQLSSSDGWASIDSLQFRLPLDQAVAFFKDCGKQRCASGVLGVGDFASSIQAANGFFWGVGPNLALAAGGPKSSDDWLLARTGELCQIARGLAGDGLAYAFIAVDHTFAGFCRGNHPSEWFDLQRTDPSVAAQLCDEVVFDAFPYQILGPGHLRRLGRKPRGSRAVAGDMVELSIGDPTSWFLDDIAPGSGWLGLADHRRDRRIQRRARKILAGCLINREETFRLLATRSHHA